jgi:hypothetical protein
LTGMGRRPGGSKSNPSRDDRPAAWGYPSLVVVVLVVALLFGGSARADAFSATIVRLAAIPLLGVAIWRLTTHGVDRKAIWPILTLAALALTAAVQLIPLPPAAWTKLPGHELAAQVYPIVGMPPPWLPASLVPDGTLNSLFALIPPGAVFLAALTLDLNARRSLLAVILATALLAVVLAMFQLAHGPGGVLRFYGVTNLDSAVGFFANRNHQASFLLAALPIAAWWTMLRPGGDGLRSSGERLIGLAMVAVLIVGLVLTRSRAAVILGGLSLTLSLVLVYRSSAREGRGQRVLLFAGVGAAVIVLIAIFSLAPTIERFTYQPLGLRWLQTPTFLRMGLDYAPFGSGLGSFEVVYQTYEPATLLREAYLMHAHDEFMEIWIEAGWFGALVVASGLGWYLATTITLWRDVRADEAGRVGSIIVALLALHSLGDYPLRTPALAVLFALAWALMIPPFGKDLAARRPRGEARRERAARAPIPRTRRP